MTIKTNLIPLPSFVQGVDAIGDISITLTINSQPSCNYQLISRNALNLSDTPEQYNIYSCLYRVQNARETIDPSTGKHLLDVSLEGWYAQLLDKEVLIDIGDNTDINSIAAKAGVALSVLNGGKSRKAKEAYLTTLNSAISQHANDEGLNVVFDNNIVLSSDGTNGAVTIPTDEVLNLEVTYKNQESYDFKFVPQYLEFEQEEPEDTSDEAESQKPVFEQIPRPTRTVINDPDNAAIPPVMGVIKTLDMNFDVSGETKTSEITTYEGEKIIDKTVTTYGYAYTTDVAAVIIEDKPQFDGNLNSFWRIVETYKITYKYDKEHYIGYDKTGYKLDRFDQESEEFEILTALNSTNSDDLMTVGFYKFRMVPISEYERLDLEAYYNYYKDALPSLDDLYISYERYDSATKKIVTEYEPNKAYVTPMFIKRKVMYSRCFDWTLVPDAVSDYTNQIKTCGEERKELYNVEIRPSKYTNSITVGSDNIEDSYDEYNESMSAQDANFKNHIKNVESSSVQGRPPSVDYYPVYELSAKNNSTTTTTTNNKKYIVSAGMGSVSGTPTGTITIYGVNSIQEAVNKLEKQLSRQRKFDGDEVTVTTFFNPNAKPNGKLMVSYDGRSFVGTIKAVNHTIKILGENVGTGTTTITASASNQNNVSLTLDPEVDKPLPNLFIPIPFVKSYVQEARDAIANLPTRGSFK